MIPSPPFLRFKVASSPELNRYSNCFPTIQPGLPTTLPSRLFVILVLGKYRMDLG